MVWFLSFSDLTIGKHQLKMTIGLPMAEEDPRTIINREFESPGPQHRINLINDIHRLKFEEPGNYSILIEIDEQVVLASTFSIIEVKMPLRRGSNIFSPLPPCLLLSKKLNFFIMPNLIASDSPDASPFWWLARLLLIMSSHPTEQERILGGAASYCSFAASYYTQVRMVGVVGNDFTESDMDRLRARGIDLEGLKRDGSGPSLFWKGKYHENFNRRDTLDIRLNVFENFRPDLPHSYRILDLFFWEIST